MIRDLLRKATGVTLAHAAVKPLWFLFVTVQCARLLGVEDYGVFTAVISLAALAMAPSDLGMGFYTVREIARSPELAPTFYTNYFVFRALLSGLGALVAIGAGWWLEYPAEALVALVFACVYAVMLNLRAYLRVLGESLDRLDAETYFLLGERVLIIAGGSTLLYLTREPHWTLLGMMSGVLLVTAWHASWMSRYLARFDWAFFSWRFIGTTLQKSIPFGLAGMLGLIYNRVDAVMVERLLGEAEAGQYGIAYQVLLGLLIVPTVWVMGAMLPRLSRFAQDHNRVFFSHLLRRGGIGLLGFSVGVAVAGMLSAHLFIPLLTGDGGFEPAVDALRILYWVFPLNCAHLLLTAVFVATNRQRFMPGVLLVVTVFNIAANWKFIPQYGISGAATVTLASEVLAVLGYLICYLVSRHRGLQNSAHHASA